MSSAKVYQRIAIDSILGILNRPDIDAELVAAYLEIGDVSTFRFQHLTIAASRRAVVVAVDSIDQDSEPVRNHVLRLAEEKRRTP